MKHEQASLQPRGKKQTIKGFSLAETILAMFVLSVGLLTIVALFQGTLRNSFEIRDGVIASELAQEGLEVARNARDNNFAAGGDGFTGSPTTGFSAANKHCRDTYSGSSQVYCYGTQGTLPAENLTYTSAAPFYDSTASTNTRFLRYLYIDYDSSAKTAHIKSFVTWAGHGLPPSDGSTTGCTIANSCVYAEAILTSWLKP